MTMFRIHPAFLLLLCWGLIALSVNQAHAIPPYSSATPLVHALQKQISSVDRSMLELTAKGLATGISPVPSAQLLQEHAELTMQAVNAAPWRDNLTPHLVEAYILPMRVTEEPLEPWRPVLRQFLQADIQNIPNPVQAAHYIQNWISKRVKPGTSYAFDLGPLALLKVGSGRCEELGILFVCAARAVGLPARICYTPAWRHANGNHLWVEIWNGTGWLPLSVEEAGAAAGTGWFLPAADSAPLILAQGFGPAPQSLSPTDSIHTAQPTGFLINRTAAYTNTGKLQVRIANTAGTAVKGHIQVQVFNSGRPRVISVKADSTHAEFILGTGTYLVSAASPEGLGFALVTVHKNATASVGITPLPLSALTQNAGKSPATSIWGLVVQQNAGYAAPQHQHKASPGSPAALPRPTGGHGLEARLASSDRPYALTDLLRAEDKLAQEAFIRMWGKAPARGNWLHLYNNYVAPSRISQEPFSHWRKACAARFAAMASPHKPLESARKVNQWVASLAQNPQKGRSPQLSTLAMCQLEQVLSGGSSEDRGIVAVAALRGMGIPARTLPGGGPTAGDPAPKAKAWIEFYDGHGWLPLYPELPKHLGDIKATPQAALYYGPRGQLQCSRAADTQPFLIKEKDWAQQWTLCRLSSNGTFLPVQDGEFLGNGLDTALQVPAGDYILARSLRQPDGSLSYRLDPVTIRPNTIEVLASE